MKGQLSCTTGCSCSLSNEEGWGSKGVGNVKLGKGNAEGGGWGWVPTCSNSLYCTSHLLTYLPSPPYLPPTPPLVHRADDPHHVLNAAGQVEAMVPLLPAAHVSVMCA